jgi:hypothetical protein
LLATVVGQLLGPYAALRWELDKLDPGSRVWFGTKNPLAELNSRLWDMGTAAEAASFRTRVLSGTDGFSADPLDAGRTNLLTAVSRNLESVPRLFHLAAVNREDMVEFGDSPPDDALLSLARGLRGAGWGQVELRPSWEWVVFTPATMIGALAILAVLIMTFTLVSVTGPGREGPFYFAAALALQTPFYLAAIALFMLPSAGRPSGIVKAALPTGLPSGNLDESLALAHDPLERIRLFLGALPEDDRKALLEATHYALWKTLRSHGAQPKVRTSR